MSISDLWKRSTTTIAIDPATGYAADSISGAAIGAGGTTTTTAHIGSLTPAQMQQILQGTKMSPEETKELEQLKQDRMNELKAAQLDIFKRLPCALRQSIVDKFEINQCFNDMSSVNLSPSQREMELENKQVYGRNYMINPNMYHGVGFQGYEAEPIKPFPLPPGITIEDLKQAHLDKSAEEELLNVK